VTICDGPDLLIHVLERLRLNCFADGRRQARWREAAQHTWPQRAEQLCAFLQAQSVSAKH
jgi:hypothetical protein